MADLNAEITRDELVKTFSETVPEIVEALDIMSEAPTAFMARIRMTGLATRLEEQRQKRREAQRLKDNKIEDLERKLAAMKLKAAAANRHNEELMARNRLLEVDAVERQALRDRTADLIRQRQVLFDAAVEAGLHESEVTRLAGGPRDLPMPARIDGRTLFAQHEGGVRGGGLG